MHERVHTLNNRNCNQLRLELLQLQVKCSVAIHADITKWKLKGTLDITAQTSLIKERKERGIIIYI